MERGGKVEINNAGYVREGVGERKDEKEENTLERKASKQKQERKT